MEITIKFIVAYYKLADIGRRGLFPALVTAFNCEDDLVELIAHVRIVSPEDKIASKLERQLISRWRCQKDKNLTPYDSLQRLKLDDSADKLTSPKLKIAMDFFDSYNRVYSEFSLLEVHTIMFG